MFEGQAETERRIGHDHDELIGSDRRTRVPAFSITLCIPSAHAWFNVDEPHSASHSLFCIILRAARGQPLVYTWLPRNGKAVGVSLALPQLV